MNKLVPFSKIAKLRGEFSFLDSASVVLKGKSIPIGFVFGRDSFISLLELLDEEFEKRVKDPKAAYNNPAGKLIDTIEESLPLNPKFTAELKTSIKATRKRDWISLEKVMKSLHV